MIGSRVRRILLACACGVLIARLARAQAPVEPGPETPPSGGEAPAAGGVDAGGEARPDTEAAPVFPPDLVEASLESIRGKDALEHIKVLASDRMEGRDAGSPGCERAAAYIVERLVELGLEGGLGAGQFLQEFPLEHPPEPATLGGKGVESFRTANILAKLRGSDPVLREEWVFLGAHYDHVGARKKGKVYNGADDNASGTAALLEIAAAFVEAKRAPRRSLLFLFFSAEEDGLVGSRHYVSHALVPASKVVMMVNLDMVGRNSPKEVEVYGIDTSPDFAGWLEELGEAVSLKILPRGGSIFSRSDHYSFYEAKIPVLFLHGGLHKDYHQTGDDVPGIVPKKVEGISRLGFLVALRASEVDARPEFRALPDTALAGPLGVMVEDASEGLLEEARLADDEGAVRVRSVLEGSPAEKVGIRSGDLLLGLGREKLPREGSLLAYEKSLEALHGPVDVIVWREGKTARLRCKPKID